MKPEAGRNRFSTALQAVADRSHWVVAVTIILASAGAAVAVDEFDVAARTERLREAVREGTLAAAAGRNGAVAFEEIGRSLRAAGFDPSAGVVVESGTVTTDKFEPGSIPSDAIRVQVSRDLDYPIRGLLGLPGRRVVVEAMAAQVGEAAVEIGRRGGPPQGTGLALWEAALGFPLRASAEEWAALAATEIPADRLLPALSPAEADGVGTVDGVPAETGIADFLVAMQVAAPLAAPPARAALGRFAAAALEAEAAAPATAGGPPRPLPVFRLVGGSPDGEDRPAPDGAAIPASALDRISSLARTAASGRTIRFDAATPPEGVKSVAVTVRLDDEAADARALAIAAGEKLQMPGATIGFDLRLPVLAVPGVTEASIPVALRIGAGSLGLREVSCAGGAATVRVDAMAPGAVARFATLAEDGSLVPAEEPTRVQLLAGPGVGAWIGGAASYLEPEPVGLLLRPGAGAGAGETARSAVGFAEVLDRMLASPDIVVTAEPTAPLASSQLRDEALAVASAAVGPIEAMLAEILASLRLQPGELDVRVHGAACDKPRLLP